MHTPQLSRIDPYSRVSAASRQDHAKAGSEADEFSAQLRIGEQTRGRQPERPPDDESSWERNFLDELREELWEGAEIAAGQGVLPADAEEILPEDAQDPQELRALLAIALV